LDKNLDNLLKRIDKNGIAFTEPSPLTRKISKKNNYAVFNNRRMKKTIIIDEKRIKKLLGTDML